MGVNKKLLIVGPTASGKSELAHQLALQTQSFIISADSRQSYKYLDIGTAKPDLEMQSQVVYKNLSILNPDEKDTPIAFLHRGLHWEKELDKNPIYVGGSTLYQQALLFGLDDMPKQNESNQVYLNQLIVDKGLAHVYDWLKDIDPVYITKMDGMNTQRILRALDVYMQTNKPFSSFHTNKQFDSESWLVIYPVVETNILKERIQIRVHQMVKNGLFEEVESVLKMGFTFKDPGLCSIGYSEWEAFFSGNKSKSDCIDDIIIHSWRYAKRQITWLKRWGFLNKIPYESKNLDKIIPQIITLLNSN